MQTLDYSQIDYTQIRGLKEILIPIVLYVFFQMGRIIFNEVKKQVLKKKGELFSMPDELKKLSNTLGKHIEQQNADFKELNEHLTEIKLSELRLELLRAIDHTPNEKQIIEAVYKKYKDLGGNFYVDGEMKKWREKINKTRKIVER